MNTQENKNVKQALPDWMMRESERFKTGIYQPIPEEVITMLDSEGVKLPFEHFIHVSQENPDLISFTENDKKGQADRQLKVKIGRYLTKYFPELDNSFVAKVANVYRSQFADQIVKFATTREEIKNVYRRGPSSCMSHSTEDYRTSGIHPVEVYATPDIAIAYLEDDGEITARAVCNMIQKRFTRIYGNSDIMEEHLDKLGFSYGSLNNCRILTLYNSSNVQIAPYVDGSAAYLKRLINSDYSLITNEDTGIYLQCNTNGLVEENNSACDDCGEHCDEDYLVYSSYHEMNICEHCRDNSYTYVHMNSWGEQDYLSDSLSGHTFVECDNEFYYVPRLNDLGIVHSSEDDEYYKQDDCVFSCYLDSWILESDAIEFTTSNGDTDFINTDCDLVTDHITGNYIMVEDATEAVIATGTETVYTLHPESLEDVLVTN